MVPSYNKKNYDYFTEPELIRYPSSANWPFDSTFWYHAVHNLARQGMRAISPLEAYCSCVPTGAYKKTVSDNYTIIIVIFLIEF